MAGETIRSEAICLDIRPWSKTSHVVSWLTPVGKITTVVRGAERPKSYFLGQYDLNYTCDILYYAGSRGEVHALRDCVPVVRRDGLREDYRALALAGYFRCLVSELSPLGPDCGAWYDLLSESLDGLEPSPLTMVRFELAVLKLAGLAPDFSGYDRLAEWSSFSIEAGAFCRGEGRCVRVSRETAACLDRPDRATENLQTPLDAARVIGVFYHFHVDCASDVRRTVLGMIAQNKEGIVSK